MLLNYYQSVPTIWELFALTFDHQMTAVDHLVSIVALPVISVVCITGPVKVDVKVHQTLA